MCFAMVNTQTFVGCCFFVDKTVIYPTTYIDALQHIAAKLKLRPNLRHEKSVHLTVMLAMQTLKQLQ